MIYLFYLRYMKKITDHLSKHVPRTTTEIHKGTYTNGFVGFTIVRILKGKVLLYANADIPFLDISEDESLELAEDEILEMFNDVLADFRFTHAED